MPSDDFDKIHDQYAATQTKRGEEIHKASESLLIQNAIDQEKAKSAMRCEECLHLRDELIDKLTQYSALLEAHIRSIADGDPDQVRQAAASAFQSGEEVVRANGQLADHKEQH
jgi:hypothetical protein